MTRKNRVSMRQIFLGLQEQMRAKLSLNKQVLKHPVAKGDATELEWIELLSTYLPTRYRVEKAFVIDHTGTISDQIDIVIFDRHYSPFMFRQNGQTYVPAESVYAAIEVKPCVNSGNFNYASRKVASVRLLQRTSAEIVDKGNRCPPREPMHIFGGLLAIDGLVSQKSARQLLDLDDNKFLDLGCSLTGNAFFVDHREKEMVELSETDDSLIFFFLKLLQGLQSIGTVAPMEISKYTSKLKSTTVKK